MISDLEEAALRNAKLAEYSQDLSKLENSRKQTPVNKKLKVQRPMSEIGQRRRIAVGQDKKFANVKELIKNKMR